MEVVWSEEVLRNYFHVLDYLLENWSVREIENFESRFDDLILRLQNHKEICPKSLLLNYRKCLIDKNNSLIYQEINNKIFLVAIIDNKSSHQY
ncbi:type II toxin-antitoxin system RelE/ParE family toxin [Chryseobacterium sp.]|uniref:type II toxin-antitoxin system RelE/ParE family toxin n=1 Tax=Chryseobacterium sp. TaxID=1871047 RepID=UPI002FC78235